MRLCYSWKIFIFSREGHWTASITQERFLSLFRENRLPAKGLKYFLTGTVHFWVSFWVSPSGDIRITFFRLGHMIRVESCPKHPQVHVWYIAHSPTQPAQCCSFATTIAFEFRTDFRRLSRRLSDFSSQIYQLAKLLCLIEWSTDFSTQCIQPERLFLSKLCAIPKHRMKYFSSQHIDMDFFSSFPSFSCLRNSLVDISMRRAFSWENPLSKAFYYVTWTVLCFSRRRAQGFRTELSAKALDRLGNKTVAGGMWPRRIRFARVHRKSKAPGMDFIQQVRLSGSTSSQK